MGIVKDNLYRFAPVWMLRFFSRGSIFPYHHLVSDARAPHIEFLYGFKNQRQFRADLDFLLRNYKPLNPQDLLLGKRPENSFLLTFDDGLSEVYSVIYPILKEKKVSAVFFLNPDFIDNLKSLYKHDISVVLSHLKDEKYPADKLKKIAGLLGFEFGSVSDFIVKFKRTDYFSRAKIEDAARLAGADLAAFRQNKPYLSRLQIEEMIADGFFFGGHTMSHPPLGQLDFDAQNTEIIDSINWVKKEFGLDYAMFAFPFTDKTASKRLIDSLFEYDPELILFGNSGMKKDVDNRIIQRFPLENPEKPNAAKIVVAQHLYKIYNKLIGKYRMKRT